MRLCTVCLYSCILNFTPMGVANIRYNYSCQYDGKTKSFKDNQDKRIPLGFSLSFIGSLKVTEKCVSITSSHGVYRKPALIQSRLDLHFTRDSTRSRWGGRVIKLHSLILRQANPFPRLSVISNPQLSWDRQHKDYTLRVIEHC